MLTIANPTSRLSRADRLSAAVRWNGKNPNGEGVSFGLWLPRLLASAPNQQVACADIVREWAQALRDNPHMARRSEQLDIADGWWMLSYFLSCADQLQIELLLDGQVVQ